MKIAHAEKRTSKSPEAGERGTPKVSPGGREGASAGGILALQRVLGNRAVRGMMAGGGEAPVQAKLDSGLEGAAPPAAHRPSGTGLPERLRTGIESLSGIPMDDVTVHYNSAKPSRLHALAYTQGTEIHVGPRQEKHLPHEAWHVVQQKQGRVSATTQRRGVQLNDDSALESEADAMGARAASLDVALPIRALHRAEALSPTPPAQCVVQRVARALSIPERVVVRRAVAKAIQMCANVIESGDAALAPIVSQYMNARPTADRLRGIRRDFNQIKDALAALVLDNIVYDDALAAFAQVDPHDATVIELGTLFWTAARQGEDSVAGTIVHEASHWVGVRGSDDHAYGGAIVGLSFTLARNNADTLERLAEHAKGNGKDDGKGSK